MKQIAFMFCLIALAACTATANVTPINDVAVRTGPMDVKFKMYGTGHGEVVVTMRSGDVLTGSYILDREQTIYSMTALLALAIFSKRAVQQVAIKELKSMPAWSP